MSSFYPLIRNILLPYFFNRIGGIHALQSLVQLNLSHNRLSEISFLSYLPSVVEVNLSMNEITSIASMPSLVSLQILRLNDNKVC